MKSGWRPVTRWGEMKHRSQTGKQTAKLPWRAKLEFLEVSAAFISFEIEPKFHVEISVPATENEDHGRGSGRKSAAS
jgi:hypothetical protein